MTIKNTLDDNIDVQIVNESSLRIQQSPDHVDVGSSGLEVEVIMNSELVTDILEEQPEDSVEEEEWPSLSLSSEGVKAKGEPYIKGKKKGLQIDKEFAKDSSQLFEDGNSNLLGELKFSQD